ncbi:MAG: hypothetical protein IPK16_31320 [Anaerolineales bacterium]|nr:hypothetical protein [Anaerolineales bacterium]
MTHRTRGTLCVWFVTAYAALWIAGCSPPPEAQTPGMQATVVALSTANAQLATQVAALSTPPESANPAAPENTPTPVPTVAVSTAAPLLASIGTGPLPQWVADVPLAPAEQTLVDLKIDRATNHLFVTDSSNQLHVLDATTYATKHILPIGGMLTLDAQNHRLYVAPAFISDDPPPLIHVIDTTTGAEVGAIPGQAISVDSARNRLFVGEDYVYNTGSRSPRCPHRRRRNAAADRSLHPGRCTTL